MRRGGALVGSLVGGRGRSGMSKPSVPREARRARTTHQRPPDEALHEAQAYRRAAQGGCTRRLERRHGVPHRAGFSPSIAEEDPARAATTRSLGRDLRRRSRSAAQGRIGHTARGGARGDAAPPSGTVAQRATHARAAHSRMARRSWRGSRRRIPPSARTRSARVVRRLSWLRISVSSAPMRVLSSLSLPHRRVRDSA